MATKSFTSDFSFTPASADSLIKALNKETKPKLADTSHIKELTKLDDIKAFFGKA